MLKKGRHSHIQRPSIMKLDHMNLKNIRRNSHMPQPLR